MGLLFVSLFGSALFPHPVDAGLFSFWSKASASENTSSNSQTMPLLSAALSLDPNKAVGGGDITVVGGSALLPDAGPSGTIANISDESNGAISVYTVREGDSISQIAKMFGVSSNTIVWGNDLKRAEAIKPGQTLVILPISGVQHTIVKGDTLSGLAKKYKTDVEEIKEYNGILSDKELALGESILIPDGEIATPVSSSIARSSGPEYKGYYLRPLDGGRRTQGIHGYNGVDIGAPTGTPVYASASGDVIISRSSGWNSGYGNYIVIRHNNGTQTLYAHLSKTAASVGWHVVQGQVIGYVGNTGKSTGPHLHFEIRGAKNPF